MDDAESAEKDEKSEKDENEKDKEGDKVNGDDASEKEKEPEKKIKKEPDSADKLMDTEGKGKDKEQSATADTPNVEVIDVDQLDDKAIAPPAAAAHVPPTPMPVAVPLSAFNIDVAFEASKLPLDVAIFNSARAAGGDEKIRKYLQAVLVIGGSALVPGMAHALESR